MAGSDPHPAQFEKLEPASARAGILTYVLWAISLKGDADNWASWSSTPEEQVDVTEQLQAFALIVTPSLYFASNPRPSRL